MSSTLLYNISWLVCDYPEAPALLDGYQLKDMPITEDGFILIEDDKIVQVGSMSAAPTRADVMMDCAGRAVLPAWVDAHTHLVFAASREGEFLDRLHGLSYQEIAMRGGGILNSAARLREMDAEELLDFAQARLERAIGFGTGAIEIKSGYGLTLESEVKMLKVIRQLAEQNTIPIRATFLAAHAVPATYKDNKAGYIQHIIEDMLPVVAGEGLADYMDVFCEKVAFSAAEMDTLLTASAKYGLKPKVHVNQFTCMDGIEVAVKHKAISVDHLEVMNDKDIQDLQGSGTMATLLPSAAFFLDDPYQPARQMLDAGIPVALATDYNPGSSPGLNMNFVVSLACVKMKMTPAEAIQAATVNGAAALEWSHQLGTITSGKLANLIITKPISSVAFLPYSFSESWVDKTMIKGKIQ